MWRAGPLFLKGGPKKKKGKTPKYLTIEATTYHISAMAIELRLIFIKTKVCRPGQARPGQARPGQSIWQPAIEKGCHRVTHEFTHEHSTRGVTVSPTSPSNNEEFIGSSFRSAALDPGRGNAGHMSCATSARAEFFLAQGALRTRRTSLQTTVVEYIQSMSNGRVSTSLDAETRRTRTRASRAWGQHGREQSNGRGHRARRVEESDV